MAIRVKFWGVRGSVPSPLTGVQVENKIIRSTELFYCQLRNPEDGEYTTNVESFVKKLPFYLRSTYGGNTSCVELQFDDTRVICDMGTGLRGLGNSLMKKMFEDKGLNIHFCISHLHWDHIQGFPFFPPIYVNKNDGIKNSWTFYGGTDWQKRAEVCLSGQMDPPLFPVSFGEIELMTHSMKSESVYDKHSFMIGSEVATRVRKLHHPQDTYGYRFTYKDRVIIYATDNEPWDPLEPDPRLLDLAQDADVLIIDCQYDQQTYSGKVGGVSRRGWGHGYDWAVAQVAVQAGVKHCVLFHHDPASSDEKIWDMQLGVQKFVDQLSIKAIKVSAAYEGMEIVLD